MNEEKTFVSTFFKSLGELIGYFAGTIFKCISWGVGLAFAVKFFLVVLFYGVYVN